MRDRVVIGGTIQKRNGVRMNKPVRILFTISELMHSSQVRNLYDLCSLLDRDLFQIEIGALETGDDAADLVRSLNLPLFQLRLQPTRPFRPNHLSLMAKSPIVLASKRYDVVHSLLYQSIFTEALMVKLLGRAKYVYTKSNLEWENHPFNWRQKSRLADRIISISNATDSLLEAKGFGDKREKIYLGIDTEHFRPDETKRRALRNAVGADDSSIVFGCAAQLVEWKEHLTLIDAFERLAPSHPNIHLTFCGFHQDDAYFEKFSRRIDSSAFASRISYLGTLQDMQYFYAGLDCFVLPSRNETFGYVYVEAMSCGLPVIACRAGGPLEIVLDGNTGLLVNMSDSADLAEKMAAYVRAPQLIDEHGTRARQRAKKVFSKEEMTRKSQKLYLRLAQQL